jgi:hypothetical protein
VRRRRRLSTRFIVFKAARTLAWSWDVSPEGTDKFLNAVQSSDALKSRALAIREELTDLLTSGLSESIGRKAPDTAANLAASLLVATWVVASLEAHRIFVNSRNVKKSNEAFLTLMDQGVVGTKVAVSSSLYS